MRCCLFRHSTCGPDCPLSAEYKSNCLFDIGVNANREWFTINGHSTKSACNLCNVYLYLLIVACNSFFFLLISLIFFWKMRTQSQQKKITFWICRRPFAVNGHGNYPHSAFLRRSKAITIRFTSNNVFKAQTICLVLKIHCHCIINSIRFVSIFYIKCVHIQIKCTKIIEILVDFDLMLRKLLQEKPKKITTIQWRISKNTHS